MKNSPVNVLQPPKPSDMDAQIQRYERETVETVCQYFGLPKRAINAFVSIYCPKAA